MSADRSLPTTVAIQPQPLCLIRLATRIADTTPTAQSQPSATCMSPRMTSTSERESNARRIGRLGAAEFVVPKEDEQSEKHVPSDEVRAKVKQVLADSSYRENAQRLGERMRDYGGASQAADLIEHLARQG